MKKFETAAEGGEGVGGGPLIARVGEANGAAQWAELTVPVVSPDSPGSSYVTGRCAFQSSRSFIAFRPVADVDARDVSRC